MARKSIEDRIVDKIYEFVNLVVSLKVKPDLKISEVTELTEKEIDRIKEKFGIEGVILDVDDTLRFDMKDIPKCNQEWLDMIKTKLKVIVVSNGLDGKIEEFLKSKGIDYIGFAHKPLKMNIVKACNNLGLKPEQIAMIGDGLISDVYAGKRNSMTTIMVTGKSLSSSKSDDDLEK